MPVLGGRVLPALMIVAFGSSAAAQGKACDIDEGTPAQVTRAVLNLQLAGSTSKPEDAATKLKEAVKFLNEGDMKKTCSGGEPSSPSRHRYRTRRGSRRCRAWRPSTSRPR